MSRVLNRLGQWSATMVVSRLILLRYTAYMIKYFAFILLLGLLPIASIYGEQKSVVGLISDPNQKFIEGCGCYLIKRGTAKSNKYIFFGKSGDGKESGWINLKGKVTEVFKDRPDSQKVIGGKNVLNQAYHSSNAKIVIKLIEQSSNESEESASYKGELTVSIDGTNEKIPIEGSCGC